MSAARDIWRRHTWVRVTLITAGMVLALAFDLFCFGVAFIALVIGHEVSDWGALPLIGWSSLTFAVVWLAFIFWLVFRLANRH